MDSPPHVLDRRHRPSVAARSMTRFVYEDEFYARFPRAMLEAVYGATPFLLPCAGEPPPQPRRLPGTILHVDPEVESRYAVGELNPAILARRLKREIPEDFPGVGDIDDKWHEYLFLTRLGPGLCPPVTQLGHAFDPATVDPEELRVTGEEVRRAMERRGLRDGSLLDTAVRLELICTMAHRQLGRSLVKIRYSNHSEGRLPRTDDDWISLFLDYWTETRPRVLAAAEEARGSTLTLEARILELPHLEGRVLETLAGAPEEVTFQQMVPIRKEIRVHVVEGEILEGATFLRFYPLGAYLTAERTRLFHEALRQELLDVLPGKYRKISCTADMIQEDDGKVRLIDFNYGLESGYFYPEEDLFTTGLLARGFTGRSSPFLQEARRALAPDDPRRRAQRLAALRAKYAAFMRGDVQEAFWDRVLDRSRRRIAARPLATTFLEELEMLRAAGLRIASIYVQLIAEVQATWPEITLRGSELDRWVARLGRDDPRVALGGRAGRFVWEPRRTDDRALAAPGGRTEVSS